MAESIEPRLRSTDRASPSGTAFATIAMIGVVVYAIVDVILQVLPPHYSPIRDAESDLAVGPFGWIMAINFFGRGLTCAALTVAIARSGPASRMRTVGLALFAVAGFCSALIAFFATDIARGGAATTVHGTIHVAGASTGFVFALASFWVLQSSHRSIASTIFLGVATVGLVFLGSTMIWFPDVFGLAERICLAGILGWVFATGLSVRSRA
ncbi:MAG: hypothetical protein QOH77_714 [Actinomycetota bacterium]|nr:hypothetical protein [Actinomycetota bacterium]